jgi:crotonobetainyl-CoA:carnitine CoA-transferase CaiB-like acyl-CoA transferase
MQGTPGGNRLAGPALGFHTDQILKEELGMAADEIAQLGTEGAI